MRYTKKAAEEKAKRHQAELAIILELDQRKQASWARASDAELRLIADNLHGYYSEGYAAAAREELARRIAAHTPPAPAGDERSE